MSPDSCLRERARVSPASFGQVMRQDRIVEVNGARGDVFALVDECKKNQAQQSGGRARSAQEPVGVDAYPHFFA